MNKIIIFAGFILFLMIGVMGICYAASIGPLEPLGPMKVSITGEHNSIHGGDLGSSGDVGNGEIELSNQGYVQIALGITDLYNVYAKLGAANLEYRLNWTNGRNQTLKYDYGFLWAVGNNAFYEIADNFGVGADMQFNMWFADADSISGTNSPKLTQRGSLRAYNLQTAVYLAYNHHIGEDVLTPYIGGYHSFFKIDIRKNTEFRDNDYVYVEEGGMRGEDNFGILAGLKMTATENVSLKVEGRFFAETAITAGVFYKF